MATRKNMPYSVADEQGHDRGLYQSRAEAYAEARSLAGGGGRYEVIWKGRNGKYQSKWFGKKSKNPGIRHAPWNPGKPGSAFKRCVKAVSKRKGVASPSGVCAAAGRAKYGAKKFAAMAQAGKKKKRKNPAGAAVEAYRDFHGRKPAKTLTVARKVHFHEHLAGAGKLVELEVLAPVGTVILKDFAGAILAFNEKRNQLFVEGGNQGVNLKTFGIDDPKEMETLGEVRCVSYFTRKDHLDPRDGGTAIFVHKFSQPYPDLIYRVRDKQLEFSGGNYTILPEGIDG